MVCKICTVHTECNCYMLHCISTGCTESASYWRWYTEGTVDVSQQDMGNGVWTRLGRGRCSCDMQTALPVEGIIMYTRGNETMPCH